MINKLFIITRFLFRHLIGQAYKTDCYSQEGEDLILQRLFPAEKTGFYVDIGAHHPERFSNTRLLYQSGWRGVVIDAMPGSMRRFRRKRPRDIFLECGISFENGTRDFYIFSEKALNTFDKHLADERCLEGWRLNRIQPVPVRNINAVLDEYAQKQIDLLTIDIEGLDQIVLANLDFSRFKPQVIICEVLGTTVEEVLHSKTAVLLQKEGYVLFSKLLNSTIWTFKKN